MAYGCRCSNHCMSAALSHVDRLLGDGSEPNVVGTGTPSVAMGRGGEDGESESAINTGEIDIRVVIAVAPGDRFISGGVETVSGDDRLMLEISSDANRRAAALD